jgi:hypothetical protein
VFSNALTSADWGETTIATGDLADAVARLKRDRPGRYLLAQGGVRFARSLVETGLIDEYRLVVHPVGTTAFSGGAVAHVFTTAMTGVQSGRARFLRHRSRCPPVSDRWDGQPLLLAARATVGVRDGQRCCASAARIGGCLGGLARWLITMWPRRRA